MTPKYDNLWYFLQILKSSRLWGKNRLDLSRLKSVGQNRLDSTWVSQLDTLVRCDVNSFIIRDICLLDLHIITVLLFLSDMYKACSLFYSEIKTFLKKTYSKNNYIKFQYTNGCAIQNMCWALTWAWPWHYINTENSIASSKSLF